MRCAGAWLTAYGIEPHQSAVVFALARLPNTPCVCARCRASIAARTWAIVRAGPSRALREWLHPRCALDVDLVWTFEALSRGREPFAGRDEVERVMDERMRALEAMAARARGQSEVESIEVEPARDPLGRPRVRVTLVGSAAERGGRIQSFFEQRSGDWSWASSRREYCFGLRAERIDPSQPLVAVVFAALDGVTVLPTDRAQLLAYNARALPCAVLWISPRRKRRTAASGARRAHEDDEVRRYRKVLDDCGYAGDEALVVYSRDDDAATLDAVVSALDEALPSIHAAPVEDRSPIERMCEQVHSLVELERDVGLRQVLAQLEDLLARASVRERALIAEAAARALPLRAARRSAMAILEEVTEFDASEALARCIDAVADEEREPDELFAFALDALRSRGAFTTVATVLDHALERATDDRVRRLLQRERLKIEADRTTPQRKH